MAMLRLLHTSDWHLGAPFHRFDRAEDEEAALAQLVALCRARAVDAVLIAGDIFDTAHPGAEAQGRWYRVLSQLVHEAGVGQVVAIAGNHDSGARLDSPRPLLEPFRIIVRGRLPADAEPGAALVPLHGRDGRLAALCAAVPYLREGDLNLPEGEEPLAVRQARAMAERFRAIREAAAARAAAQGLPWLVLAHAFVRGAERGGGERPVLADAELVGQLAAVEAGSLAEGAAYAAFGHLHRPQAVGGRMHWRYSGSLLPQAFDEAADRPNLVLVELDSAGARVEPLALPRHRRYASLHGSLDEVLAAIAALPQPAPGEPQPLLAASVVLAQERAGVAQEVAAAAQQRGWLALRVQRQIAAADAAMLAASGTGPAPDIAELQPIEVLRHAHRLHYGCDPSPELEQAFLTLLADTTGA